MSDLIPESEIVAALQAAFAECDAASSALNHSQKEILLNVVVEILTHPQAEVNSTNPLDELSPEERQALLGFVKEHERQNRSWKVKLLNDWLLDRNSGSVQFIRDRYGPQWLNRIKPIHVVEYLEQEAKETLKLKVGDRIEICNSLWEWVQEDGPCAPQWFPCRVIQVYETKESDRNLTDRILSKDFPKNKRTYTNCVIRFENGMEFELQGVYDWNRYNWRWSKD